jgi:hypothetical protein
MNVTWMYFTFTLLSTLSLEWLHDCCFTGMLLELPAGAKDHPQTSAGQVACETSEFANLIQWACAKGRYEFVPLLIMAGVPWPEGFHPELVKQEYTLSTLEVSSLDTYADSSYMPTVWACTGLSIRCHRDAMYMGLNGAVFPCLAAVNSRAVEVWTHGSMQGALPLGRCHMPLAHPCVHQIKQVLQPRSQTVEY